MWNDTSAGNRCLDEGIQLFISANGQLQVTRRDALDLEILAGVSGQFEHFCREVFQNGRRVDGSRRSDALGVLDG